MFLSSSDQISNVEDEALHSFNWQRSLIRLTIVFSALACGWCMSFATEPAPAKKKVVHSTSPAAKKPATGKGFAKAPVKGPTKASAKAPVKSAGVPHVIARAGVKHTSAA